MFIKIGREIFRELKQAEKAHDEAKNAAIEAGVPEDDSDSESDSNNSDDSNDSNNNNNDKGDIYRNLKRKLCDEDYDHSRILQWLEDPDRPAKHKRRIRPNHYEMEQQFDYVPVSPSDSGSAHENDPFWREKFDTHEKQRDEERKNLDERMPDALPDTEDYGIFEFPRIRISTPWEKQCESASGLWRHGVGSREVQSELPHDIKGHLVFR
jgi:hypothetical protein